MATPQRSEKVTWLHNIQALLISVDDDYIQSCSISVVPESLKRPNHDVYMPRVVSIGPRFKDSRDELLLMEEVKLRCMLSVLHRGTDTGFPNLKKCSEAVWELDEYVRASYVVGIELTQAELAKIMLLDGCFLLELLISKGLELFPEEFPLNFKSRLSPACPTAEVLKNEDVLSDLMLFENQIPILVLHTLSQIIFPEEFEPDRNMQIETEEIIEMEQLNRKNMEEPSRPSSSRENEGIYLSGSSSSLEDQRIETEDQRRDMEEIIEMEQQMKRKNLEEPSRLSSSRENEGIYLSGSSSSLEEQRIETEDQRRDMGEIIEMEEQKKRKNMEEPFSPSSPREIKGIYPSFSQAEQWIETEEQIEMAEIIEMEEQMKELSRPSSSRESKGKYPSHASSSREEQRVEMEEQRKYTEEIIEMEDQIEMEEMKRKKMEEQIKMDEKMKRKKMEEQIKMEEKMIRKMRANKINNLALSVLGYSSHDEPNFESPHFLDLVHFFVNRTCERGAENVGNDNPNANAADTNPKKLKLKSCALRLRAAGVSFQVIEGEIENTTMISCLGLIKDCFSVFIWLWHLIVKSETTNQVDTVVTAAEMKGLDFEFKFNNGKLEIAKLHITKTTKAKWRNVIAWEHHHKYNDKSPRCKFTSSALIFDGLICCEADLNFLKEKKIIVDDTKMSNDELKEFFRTMPLGVDPGVVDPTYVTMVEKLNNYSSKAFFILGIFKLSWHLLTIRLEWLVKFLKRNYNFVAMFILLFGFVRVFRSDVVPLIQYIKKLDE